MYQMTFDVKGLVVDGLENERVKASVFACDGTVHIGFDEGVEVVLTPTQAKDLTFSVRKAVYEAQRETQHLKKYGRQQKGGVQ